MSKTKSKFRGKVSRNVDKQKQDESNYGYLIMPKDVEILKLDGKRIYLDVIPYVVSAEDHPDRDDKLEIAIPGELWYKRPFKIHRSIGSGNDSFICPTSIGKKCPICEYRSKRMKEGADKKETDALRASLRNLYAVIPIGHKELDEKIYIWDYSQYLFQKLLNQEVDDNPKYETFPDLEEGYTLNIRWEEESLEKNKFYAADRIDFEKREEVYEESILDGVPDLDKMLKILTYQELERKFLEIDEEDATEETVEEIDEEKKPVRRKRPIEKEEDKEEEEEETPARKRKTTPVQEEEEDENPIRRRSRKESKPEPEKKVESEEKPEPEKKAGKGKDRCPHSHKFGVDTDKKDECNKCKIWDDCIDEKEANE